jgi:hypothetical protein
MCGPIFSAVLGVCGIEISASFTQGCDSRRGESDPLLRLLHKKDTAASSGGVSAAQETERVLSNLERPK